MRSSPASAALLLIAALAGCGRGPRLVLLIDIDPVTISDADVAAIRALALSVTGAETFQASFPIGNELTGRSAQMTYRPDVSAGALSFVVQVSRDTLEPIGRGSASDVSLAAASPIPVHIVVTAIADNPPPDMGREDQGESPDLGALDLAVLDETTNDAPIGADLSTVDLAMSDRSTIDLAPFPDLQQPDLTTPDLTTPDLATVDLWRPALPAAVFSTPAWAPGPGSSNTAGVAIADFNNDTHLDLVAANFLNYMTIHWGNGDGTVKPGVQENTVGVVPGMSTSSVVASDFNHDGIADFAAAKLNLNSTKPTIAVVLSNGDGTFAPAVDYVGGSGQYSEVVKAADFTGDGHLDLFCSVYSAPSVFLRGRGDGTFDLPVDFGSPWGGNFALGDFVGDSKVDVAFAGKVWIGNSSGPFAAPLVAGGPDQPFAVADFNGDGRLDLADAHSIGLGNGDGTFRTGTVFGNYGSLPVQVNGQVQVAAADFNHDGQIDLAVLFGFTISTAGVDILLGYGDGAFAAPTHIPVPLQMPTSIAAADLDGNLRPDLVLTDGSIDDWRHASVMIILNTTP